MSILKNWKSGLKTRMKFKLADIQNYTQSAPEHSEKNYQIVFSAVGNRRIEPEVKAVVQRLARQRKKNPLLLWFVGLSSVESRGNLKKVYKRSGKRGRPPLEIVGKQVAPHCHIFLATRLKNKPPTSDYKSLLDFIKKRRKKFGNLKQAKSGVVYGMGYCGYTARQSEHVFKTLDYDWEYFQSAYYDDEF